MGFLSYEYKQKLEEEDKKAKEAPKKDGSKKDSKSFLSKATDALFGNTKKTLGTARAGAGGVYGLGKIAKASLFGSDEEYNKEIEGVNKTLEKDLSPGKTFFKDKAEADNISTADLAKKTVAAGLATGAEVIPFARGASVATKGVKTGVGIAKTAAEGAAYGAVGNAASQAAEDGNVDLGESAKSALFGAAGGAGGFLAGRGASAVAGKVRPGQTPKDIVNYPNEELDQLLPKKIPVSGGDEAAIALTGKPVPRTMAAAVDPASATLDAQGNYTSGSLKGQPPLTIVDTRATTPKEARASIALEAVQKPKTNVAPAERAKAALVDNVPTSGEKPVTPVGEGAQTLAERLDDQLTSFGKTFAAPKEIIQALKGADTVTRSARKHDWLNHYEDTLSVLGRHFGKVGTDLGYKLAEGAKQVSDIQDAVRPSIDKTQKLLGEISKTKAGRSDVQSRIYAAAEDRANAANYIKTPKEQELFDETVKVLDFFKDQRIQRGKSVVGEDYSPRTAIRNALDAPQRILDDARSAFSPDVKSKFSKERSKEVPDADINRNLIDLLPQYAASQSKEFGYEGALEFAQKNLPNVNPAYLTDGKSRRQGEEYLRTLFGQVLDPATATKSERLQNKVIANTYRNQLGFSLKYAFQNLSQRYATKSVVSKQADQLARDMDSADVDSLRKEMISGSNPITSEATQTADSTGKTNSFFQRFDPGTRVEKGNVENSFDRGVAQELVGSKVYKDAISRGATKKEAAKIALQDPTVRDLATRRGNIVVNDTQFGANFVTKPEFFRDSGTFFGLSDKWFKQYQRFPHGMIQNMSTILRANDARALDILKRGNPAETNLVDYKYSAESLRNGVDDLIKGIKNGEVHDVSLEVAEGYQKTLQKAVNELDSQMKKVSQVSGKKTAKSVAKMWAAASAIQFLFDGGLSMVEDDQNKEIRKSIQYGAPVSIPTKDQNPLAGALVPSSPFKPEFRPEKAANLVPVAGLVVNRGREIKRFADALTGDSGQ